MTDGRLNLGKVVMIASRVSQDGFVREFPYPVLLPESVLLGELRDQPQAGATLVHVPSIVPKSTLIQEAPIMVVRKRSEMGRDDLIFLGRTATSDLIVSDFSVSKEHAVFRRVAGEHWELEDLGSRNGTFVDETRLQNGVPLRLASPSKLQFGRVQLAFLDPVDLYLQLRLMA